MRFLRKYGAFATAALKRALRYSAGTFGSASLLCLLVAVFSQLWIAIGRHYDLSAYGFSIDNIIWYVAITELATICAVRIERVIENDIRSGDIVYTLTRPVSYFMMKQSEALGQILFRYPLYTAVSFATAYLFTGKWMIGADYIAPMILMSIGTVFLFHLSYSLIGLTAFWLQESSAASLVFNKFLFVLGGIWLPLEFFPEWVRTISIHTPFPVMLYAPAHFALSPTWESTVFWGTRMVFWLVVLITLNLFVMRRATKSLCINGG